MRVLKFDTFYPTNYLDLKKSENKEILAALNYEEYYDWLMSQRSYLSDFFTFQMNKNGWEAIEFITHDSLLIKKLIENGTISTKSNLWFLKNIIFRLSRLRLIDFITFKYKEIFKKDIYYYLDLYIQKVNPDIIFLREPTQLNGDYFTKYKNRKFIISLIGCRTEHALNWNEKRSDLILTILPEYQSYYNLQGVDSILIEYGVDKRIYDESTSINKKYDCVFVGLLGDPVQKLKSQNLEYIAQNNKLLWWGIKGADIDLYPNLVRTWQGYTSGIDMYKIYGQSKIILNDYVDTANNKNVNLRTKEVWSVGGFLLTRQPSNDPFFDCEKKPLAYYLDSVDCLSKIEYYLENEKEREIIADYGRQYALENYNYEEIIVKLMNEIELKYKNWKEKVLK